MIYAGYPPGSFNDARHFGWRSIAALVARWWPIYAFGLLAVLAATLARVDAVLHAAIVFFLLTTPGFVTCATLFRGRFALTPSLLGGITLTYVLPSIALEFVLRSTLLVPVSASARIAILLVELIVGFWLYPKLNGAGCFYLLGAGKLTPRECFALGWRYIAGDVWVTQFTVGFVGVLVVIIPVVIVRLFLRSAQLDLIGEILLTISTLVFNLYYSSALMRIVSASHGLFETYWKASENNAQ